MPEKTIYTWKFDDKRDRGVLWHTIALAIVIGLSVWGFITKQYGMSFTILLIAGLVYFLENNAEEEMVITINRLGIKIGNCFYDYPRIHSYCFIYNNEHPVLLRLNLNKKGLKNIDVMVDATITGELQNILPEFLEENKKGELSFTDKIITKLKL